jgi:outer membrane immunogenic protein
MYFGNCRFSHERSFRDEFMRVHLHMSVFLQVRLCAGVALVAGSMLGAAKAADPSVWGAPPYRAPLPAYSWTGCYVGIAGGADLGRTQHFQNDPTAAAKFVGEPQTNGIETGGGSFGGTVGCNYQVGGWVLGIEDDLSWTDTNGSANFISPFKTSDSAQTSEAWFDTLRGRLGYTWNRYFLYATGGAAFAREGVMICDPIAGCASESRMTTGFAVGGGLEYAFWASWSVKIEYLHVDFGKQPFAAMGPFSARNVTLTDEIIRGGINYKFTY